MPVNDIASPRQNLDLVWRKGILPAKKRESGEKGQKSGDGGWIWPASGTHEVSFNPKCCSFSQNQTEIGVNQTKSHQIQVNQTESNHFNRPQLTQDCNQPGF
jgi:hypothetical protein